MDRTLIVGRRNPQKAVDIDLGALSSAYQGVSRQHLEIDFEDGHVVVRDLNSRNGTLLNGTALEPFQSYAIPDEAHLRVGKTHIAISIIDTHLANGDASPTISIPLSSSQDLEQALSDENPVTIEVLRAENARLRRIVADQALKIQELLERQRS